ncbi:MAG: universal stress protein [Planctomycetota bacterium]|nr:universal stress protein [Planctomycetota bacterium]
MNVRHVLLTTDLSPESTRPYGPVQELVKKLGARVTLMNVVLDLQAVPHGAAFAPAVSSATLGAELERAREQLAEHRADFGDLDVRTEVIAAPDVARAICRWAESHDVDLIAISTHGRKGWRHLALGSVAEQVLRYAEVPVLSFHRPRE